MKGFDHPNVVCLLGVCVDAGPSPYVVMPFMANGSLLAFLKKERGTLLISADDEEEMVTITESIIIYAQVSNNYSYYVSH